MVIPEFLPPGTHKIVDCEKSAVTLKSLAHLLFQFVLGEIRGTVV